MSFLKSKKLFSVLLIVLVAVATGFSVGKIYVDNIEVETKVSAKEEDVREISKRLIAKNKAAYEVLAK